jgi:hypothetical protein
MPTNTSKNLDTPNRIGQMTEDREKRKLEPVNSESIFLDPDKTIKNLADKAFPENDAEQARYAEKIKLSLEAHMKKGDNIDTLWAYLKSRYCQTAAIITGLLHFFAGKKGENEISIARFLKPIEIPGKSAYRETTDIEKGKEVEKTKSALLSFWTDLKKDHPDLPPLPSQIA